MTTLFSFAAAVPLSLSLTLTLVLPTHAQEPQRPGLVFRSEVRGVLVDVFVTKDDRPVTGLEAEDFAIFDNGTRQSDVSLVLAQDLPLVTTLLLDTSQSVRGTKLRGLRAAASAFIDELNPVDSVSVVTFGTHFRLHHAFTEDHAAARASLDRLRGSGATALLDGLLFSLVHGEDLGRRLVVVFSDGLDTASWLSPDDVVASAQRSQAVLFAVRANAGAFEQTGDRALRKIVSATAGRVVLLRSDESVEEAFKNILTEMRSRYLLAYAPSDPAEGWHELTVQLKDDPEVELRARPGYYYP